jgi:hypothetical protein
MANEVLASFKREEEEAEKKGQPLPELPPEKAAERDVALAAVRKASAKYAVNEWIEKVTSGEIELTGMRENSLEPREVIPANRIDWEAFHPLRKIAICVGGVTFHEAMQRRGGDAVGEKAKVAPPPTKQRWKPRVNEGEVEQWARRTFDLSEPFSFIDKEGTQRRGKKGFEAACKQEFGEDKVVRTMTEPIYDKLWPEAKQGRLRKSPNNQKAK